MLPVNFNRTFWV